MRMLAPVPPNVSFGLPALARPLGRKRVPHLVGLTALLVGLAFAAPVDAAPILISGEYLLSIGGGGGGPAYPDWSETVTQSITGDFSESLSESADVSPFHYESAASLSFSMTDNEILAEGGVAAYGTPLDALGPSASAYLELEFTFSLTEAYLVSGSGDFLSSVGAAPAFSFLTFDGMSSGIGLTPPGFDRLCNPESRLCFEGILPAGTYTVSGYASVGGGGNDYTGRSAPLSFGIAFAPVPEPSAALLFAAGFIVAAAGRRRR